MLNCQTLLFQFRGSWIAPGLKGASHLPRLLSGVRVIRLHVWFGLEVGQAAIVWNCSEVLLGPTAEAMLLKNVAVVPGVQAWFLGHRPHPGVRDDPGRYI
jgi:hypothetical protein